MGQDSRAPRYCIKAVSGPLRGTSFTVQGQLTIGRAEGVDIRIRDGRVSRHHACITHMPTGEFELLDLRSANGTHCGDLKIERMALQPGATFEISGNEFVFERVGDESATTVDLSPGGELLRPTKTLQRADDPVSTSPELEPDPDHDRDPRADTIRGINIVGQIIEDIVEYRVLRHRRIQGALLGEAHKSRFETLHRRLASESADSRVHVRFRCDIPSSFQAMGEAPRSCQVDDIGVDGVGISAKAHGLRVGDVISVSITRGRDVDPVRLSGRVVWTQADELGLMFLGGSDLGAGRYSNPKPVEARVEAGGGRAPVDDQSSWASIETGAELG
ncbi:MAG: FHA domain-containing protein [Nannocystaceae bacterium]